VRPGRARRRCRCPAGSPSRSGFPAGPRPHEQVADIIELILADHRRIRRLLDALAVAGRRDGIGSLSCHPGPVWPRVAELILLHTEAEQEICYLPLFRGGPWAEAQWRDAIADHDDIRAALQETALQPAARRLGGGRPPPCCGLPATTWTRRSAACCAPSPAARPRNSAMSSRSGGSASLPPVPGTRHGPHASPRQKSLSGQRSRDPAGGSTPRLASSRRPGRACHKLWKAISCYEYFPLCLGSCAGGEP
jgi:hypothetical protein